MPYVTLQGEIESQREKLKNLLPRKVKQHTGKNCCEFYVVAWLGCCGFNYMLM
jgi:hypothetical protein